MKPSNQSRATNEVPQLSRRSLAFPVRPELQMPEEKPELSFEVRGPPQERPRPDRDTERVLPGDVPLIPAWVLQEDREPSTRRWRIAGAVAIGVMLLAALVLWLVSLGAPPR